MSRPYAGRLVVSVRAPFIAAVLVAVFFPAFASADALHMAAKSGDITLVERLLAQGHDINVRDENEATPLHWAVYAGHEVVARLLIAKGADIYANEIQLCCVTPRADGATPGGVTPLHWAASGGHVALARLLLTAGVNINAETIDGVTPLAVAVMLGHQEIIDLLRAHGGRQ